VVGSGLATALDQDRNILSVLSIPCIERRQDLETVGAGGDVDLDRDTVFGGSLVGVTSGVVSTLGQIRTVSGRSKEELLSILALKGVGQRVEVQGTGNGEGSNQIGGGDKSVGSGVGVVAASEVAVVRRDDGIGLTFLDVLTVPLSNTGSASVGQDDTTELLEGGELTITLDSSTYLFGAGGDGEDGLGLNTVAQSVTGN